MEILMQLKMLDKFQVFEEKQRVVCDQIPASNCNIGRRLLREKGLRAEGRGQCWKKKKKKAEARLYSVYGVFAEFLELL